MDKYCKTYLLYINEFGYEKWGPLFGSRKYPMNSFITGVNRQNMKKIINKGAYTFFLKVVINLLLFHKICDFNWKKKSGVGNNILKKKSNDINIYPNYLLKF
jgi:hypothetical protein